MTRRGGFTLLETLIAIVLLSVGALALAGSAAAMARQLAMNAKRQRATMLARSHAEELQSRGDVYRAAGYQ